MALGFSLGDVATSAPLMNRRMMLLDLVSLNQ
jgi:hypothetical protein